MDEEAIARCALKFDANRQSLARDLVGFADRGMRFQKCDTVFELNFERVAPREIPRIPKPTDLAVPNGTLPRVITENHAALSARNP